MKLKNLLSESMDINWKKRETNGTLYYRKRFVTNIIARGEMGNHYHSRSLSQILFDAFFGTCKTQYYGTCLVMSLCQNEPKLRIFYTNWCSVFLSIHSLSSVIIITIQFRVFLVFTEGSPGTQQWQ